MAIPTVTPVAELFDRAVRITREIRAAAGFAERQAPKRRLAMTVAILAERTGRTVKDIETEVAELAA